MNSNNAAALIFAALFIFFVFGSLGAVVVAAIVLVALQAVFKLSGNKPGSSEKP